VGDITVTFLSPGGQQAADVLARLIGFIAGATHTLDLAVYDAHLEGGGGDELIAALNAAEGRGVTVRAVYNDVERKHPPIPPPPAGPSLLQQLANAVPAKAISGIPDLMHHKYVVRDGADVWTGSTNWSTDSWTKMENLIVVVNSADLAAAYTQDFEQLWGKGHVEKTGTFDDAPSPDTTFDGQPAPTRALFSPGRGRSMSQLIATRLGQARTRIRICSPVITSSPILGTLAEVLDDKRCDTLVTVDGPQMGQALSQWRQDGRVSWKGPLFEKVRASGVLAEKPSTPWGPGTVHDFMHAKVVVCDDWVLTGSFNCSHSGEFNAENLLEIHNQAFADRCAAFCEEVHERYRSARPS
jgi:phosphatidylserine/phosphatidylglycerophosphate/cardiolipin synthase-like enzyme